MIKLENYEVLGWEHAIRGMRNPMNSWDKSDSTFKETAETHAVDYSDNPDGAIKTLCVQFDALSIGPNDHELMMKLRNAGTDHRKFMRMIDVYVDITAPLYWWKEFDTYKVGTVANSCSTMHKIHSEEIKLDDFSVDEMELSLVGEDYEGEYIDYYNVGDCFTGVVENCELLRKKFVETGDKRYWRALIQLLPSSYNQKRTVKLNYEVLANIYESRKNHKLDEWRELCKWIEELPYSELIVGEANV